MARPTRRNLEYFNVPVSYFQDDKFWLILNEIGLEAEVIFMRLLAKIYGNQGFYYFFSEKELKILSGQTGISSERILEILNAFFENELFDKSKYERYQILTSFEVQEQYFTIIKSTKRKIFINEHEFPYIYSEINSVFELDIPDIEQDNDEVSQSVNTVSSEFFRKNSEKLGIIPEKLGITPNNSGKTPKNSDKSKVKKSKEKKSKVNKKPSTVTGSVENFSENSELIYWKKLLGDFAGVWGAPPGSALEDKLRQWIEFKQSKGFKFQPKTKPWLEFLERLKTLSEGDQTIALAILKQSLEHGWVDVYPFISLSPEGIQQKWTAFVETMKNENPQLYQYVSQLQLRNFDKGIITIRGPDKAITMLEDIPEPNPYFENLRRFFGKKIKIEYEVLQRLKKLKKGYEFSENAI